MKSPLTLTRALLLALALIHFSSTAETLPTATTQSWTWGAQLLLRNQDSVQRLTEAIDSFLAAPDEQTLTQSRTAWLNSHRQWLQLSPLLCLSDQQPALFSELQRRRFLLDAGEIQPGYLDALPGYPHSGLVNDLAITLSADALRAQHGLTDNSEVSLGFHALELLLWGADGERSPEDFLPRLTLSDAQRGAGYELQDLPNNRRRELLRLVSQILAEDIQALQLDWHNPESPLSRAYLQLEEDQRLRLLQNALTAGLKLQGAAGAEPLNAFAGDRHYRWLAPLEGVEELLVDSEGDLLSGLLDADKRSLWLERLRLQVAALRTLREPPARVTADYWSQFALISEALRQLAAELEQH